MLNKKIAAMSILTVAAVTIAPLATQACGCGQKLNNGTTTGCANKANCANNGCTKKDSTGGCACKGKKANLGQNNETKRLEVSKAIEANDYNAWLTAEGGASPIVKAITIDKFPKYIELYNLEKQVKQLKDVLGLNTMKPGLNQTPIVK